MDNLESTIGVGSRIPRTRREPIVQLGQENAREPALFFVVPRVANVFVSDAVSVEFRFVANPTVPATIMPS